MTMRVNKAVRAVSVAGFAASVALVAGVTPAGAGGNNSLHGVFNETTAGATAGYDIHGSAKMKIGPAGTVVTVNVSGLDPVKVYASHLHNDTCATGGGGHYQDDEGGSIIPPNELHLSYSTGGMVPNRGGVAHANGSAPWEARINSTMTNAKSVVVHEPNAGPRIACADLN